MTFVYGFGIMLVVKNKINIIRRKNMKKFLSIALVVVMIASIVCLVGCGNKEAATVKLGLGVSASYGEVKNADGDVNGEGEAVVDIAAVLVDAEGKIVKCVLDCADSKAQFTAKGKVVEAGEFKTKYEMLKDYNMVAYGNAKAEWYEQADSFATLVAGKTIDEVKALVAEDGKGTEEVANAGCTIYVSGFVKAIELAVANAADSAATAESTLKLGVVTSQSGKDATEEANGEAELATTVVASALDAEKKVVAASTDVASVKFTFDLKGKSTTDTTAALTTKKAAGADYGMAKYGQDLNGDGVVKEWEAQAEAFNAALVGKDASGISALAVETGYGAADLQSAGCTIHVGDMVKAAVKSATV